jgi:hypothetical protein
MYLDSLEVDEVISDCTRRVDARDSSLINKVNKKDMISPGVSGKLQVSSDTIHKTFFLFLQIICIVTHVFCKLIFPCYLNI